MQARSFRNAWTIIQRDPDIAIVIFAAALLGILRISDIEWITGRQFEGITLLILALFAFALLRILYFIRNPTFTHLSPSFTSVSTHFPPSFNEDIIDAKELCLFGVSLSTVLVNHRDKLKKKLAQGDRLKILLVNPESHACDLLSTRDQPLPDALSHHGIGYQQARIRGTLETLSEWKKEYPEQVDIKMTHYPLDFETVLAKIGNRKVLYMRHYPFRTPFGEELHLVIPSHDVERFRCYEQHFDNLWEDESNLQA